MSARRAVGPVALLAVVILGATLATPAESRVPGASAMMHRDTLRPGPDSARVSRLLDVLGKTDPLVCELVADQLGNSWWSGNAGLGRFSDAPLTLQPVKDSLVGRVRDPRAIRLLTLGIASDNECVRRVSAKLLGSSAVRTDALVSLLSNASPRVREAAAYALGHAERKDARGALERMLQERTGAEAAMAVWALGSVGDTAALSAIHRAARSSDARVRLAAIWAMGELSDERSLSELVRALADGVAEVRYAAADAIGNLHEIHVAPEALVRAARSSDPKLRRLAAHALAEIHDPATLDVFIELLASADRDVRLEAIQAIGEIGSSKAKPGLMRALRDADAEVRKAAAEALGEMKPA